MARNEKLEARVREALAAISNVEEKVMFSGMAFMVNGKLCIAAGDNELMFRINPDLQETVLEKPGVSEMLRSGKAIKGYVYVHEEALKSRKEFDYWTGLALDYNKQALPSKKKAGR